jgi:hypothetical protein
LLQVFARLSKKEIPESWPQSQQLEKEKAADEEKAASEESSAQVEPESKPESATSTEASSTFNAKTAASRVENELSEDEQYSAFLRTLPCQVLRPCAEKTTPTIAPSPLFRPGERYNQYLRSLPVANLARPGSTDVPHASPVCKPGTLSALRARKLKTERSSEYEELENGTRFHPWQALEIISDLMTAMVLHFMQAGVRPRQRKRHDGDDNEDYDELAMTSNLREVGRHASEKALEG